MVHPVCYKEERRLQGTAPPSPATPPTPGQCLTCWCLRSRKHTAKGETNTVGQTTRLAALRRYFAHEGADNDSRHEIYHDDAVLEFPQSQERFVGKENFITWRERYPASVKYNIRRIRGQGDFWVAEISLSYDGGPWNYGCSIVEFRGDKIARETIYVTSGVRNSRCCWRPTWTRRTCSTRPPSWPRRLCGMRSGVREQVKGEE